VTTPFVVVGGPVRQRSWVVARHIAALDACRVNAFAYVLGDSTDNTDSVIRDAHNATDVPRVMFTRPDAPGAGYDRIGPPRYSMANLAEARQAWVEAVLRAFPCATHLWSCDSDIIVDPNVLRLLLAVNAPMVGANVALNYSLTARNVMTGWENNAPRRRFGDADLTNLHMPVTCTWVGACVLYERRVFEPADAGGLACSFTAGDPTRMEEAGIVTRLHELGVSPVWCPQARTSHVQRDGTSWR
jgi:hypothetical protein